MIDNFNEIELLHNDLITNFQNRDSKIKNAVIKIKDYNIPEIYNTYSNVKNIKDVDDIHNTSINLPDKNLDTYTSRDIIGVDKYDEKFIVNHRHSVYDITSIRDTIEDKHTLLLLLDDLTQKKTDGINNNVDDNTIDNNDLINNYRHINITNKPLIFNYNTLINNPKMISKSLPVIRDMKDITNFNTELDKLFNNIDVIDDINDLIESDIYLKNILIESKYIDQYDTNIIIIRPDVKYIETFSNQLNFIYNQIYKHHIKNKKNEKNELDIQRYYYETIRDLQTKVKETITNINRYNQNLFNYDTDIKPILTEITTANFYIEYKNEIIKLNKIINNLSYTNRIIFQNNADMYIVILKNEFKKLNILFDHNTYKKNIDNILYYYKNINTINQIFIINNNKYIDIDTYIDTYFTKINKNEEFYKSIFDRHRNNIFILLNKIKYITSLSDISSNIKKKIIDTYIKIDIKSQIYEKILNNIDQNINYYLNIVSKYKKHDKIIDKIDRFNFNIENYINNIDNIIDKFKELDKYKKIIKKRVSEIFTYYLANQNQLFKYYNDCINKLVEITEDETKNIYIKDDIEEIKEVIDDYNRLVNNPQRSSSGNKSYFMININQIKQYAGSIPFKKFNEIFDTIIDKTKKNNNRKNENIVILNNILFKIHKIYVSNIKGPIEIYKYINKEKVIKYYELLNNILNNIKNDNSNPIYKYLLKYHLFNLKIVQNLMKILLENWKIYTPIDDPIDPIIQLIINIEAPTIDYSFDLFNDYDNSLKRAIIIFFCIKKMLDYLYTKI